MWKLAVLPLIASVILQQAAAQGGAESLAFPGYLPIEYVKAAKPIADEGPNDVYQHLRVYGPELGAHEVVIYPHHFVFEYGQDPERSIYEVHNAKELQAAHNKKHSKKKHNKHGKKKHGKHAAHGHDHGHGDDDHHHHHHEEHEHQHQHGGENEIHFPEQSIAAPAPQQPRPQNVGYNSQPPKKAFRPRPAYASVPAHFGG